MRIGVYGLPGYPPTAAFASGLAAVGHRVVWRRASIFTPDQAEREFQVVVVYGAKKGEAKVIETYTRLRVPVIVVDLGYLRRERDMSQVGLGGLCWLPPFACSSDRWRALELPLAPPQTDGTFVLIAGQRPRDASHGLGQTYQDWLDRTVTRLRALTDRPLVWRPHPRDPDVMPSVAVDAVSSPSVPIADAMQGAHAVVTYNSTVGSEAIIAGVPVVSDPVAMYAGWAETDLARIETPRRLIDAERLDYLSRLGYAQWTLGELADGSAARFITGVLQGEIPVPSVEPEILRGTISDVLPDQAPVSPLAPKPRRSRRKAVVPE